MSQSTCHKWLIAKKGKAVSILVIYSYKLKLPNSLLCHSTSLNSSWPLFGQIQGIFYSCRVLTPSKKLGMIATLLELQVVYIFKKCFRLIIILTDEFLFWRFYIFLFFSQWNFLWEHLLRNHLLKPAPSHRRVTKQIRTA